MLVAQRRPAFVGFWHWEAKKQATAAAAGTLVGCPLSRLERWTQCEWCFCRGGKCLTTPANGGGGGAVAPTGAVGSAWRVRERE